jgi:putative transposase
LDEDLAQKIRAILDQEETFGYRRAWAHLRFKEQIRVNLKKVHRIMKLKGWQCRLWNRPSHLPKATRVSRSTADQPDRLWCLDSTKVFCGQDGWASLIALLDAGSREVVGYRFSLRGRAIEAMDALEQGLLRAYGALKAPEGLALRSDNASIFLSRGFVQLTRQLSLRQEFTPRYSPEYNGSIERFFRTLKQECVWLHRFDNFEEAERIIPAWIEHYNQERLHSSLGYMAPREWRKQFYLPLAA